MRPGGPQEDCRSVGRSRPRGQENVSKSRKQKWLLLIAVPPILVGVFVVGLFIYVNATARPLHPDPTAVSSVTQWSPSQQWTDAVEQARQAARASLVEKNLPGLSVAVGAGGEIVWAEGFGWADLEKRLPVAPGMRFRTGGASMALTSAAVGLLLEKERVHLDGEIQTYVPAFPEKQWPVTLRQLMGHMAGIRRDGGDEEPLFSERCERTTDGLKRFAGIPLQFEPGTRYQYSTLGWILVSAAVEAAAKEPFFPFMREQVFKPLGMTDTTPDSATEPLPDLATFYYPRFGGNPRYGPELARDGGYSCFAGAGAFLSTPSDLVRFAMAFNSGKLLQPATVKTLQTSQHLASGEETGYGLGWDRDSVSLAGESTTMVGHDGEFFIGGSTSLTTFPDRGIVVAVTTNTSFAETGPIALKIAQAFAERARSPARK
jgi:serine beta-lactamase-like protein LACTB, mitochondrial